MHEVSCWRLRDILTAVALFLATAGFTLWQNTQIAALWDLSFLLDTSYRWSIGQVPYRDLPFPHAPLTFLLHAGIMRLFGRVYYPHVLCAALEGGVATVLAWRILLNLLNLVETSPAAPIVQASGTQGEGTLVPQPPKPQREPRPAGHFFLATVLALPLTVLGIYGVYIHPIYDSDCILAVLVALYLLQRAGESPARNALAGAACVVPLFCKQNIGLPFLLIVLVCTAILGIVRRRGQASVVPQLWLFGGAAAALGAALLLLQGTVGLGHYLYWTITFAAHRRYPGLRLVLVDYLQAWLLWTLPAAIGAVVLLRSPRLRARSWSRPAAAVLLAAPFVWTVAALFFSNDPDDRADQLLSLWPHVLLLGAVLAVCNLRPGNLRAHPAFNTFLPLILLALINGSFLAEQLWGSSFAIWPLLTLLIAALLLQVSAVARPVAAVIATAFLVCGGLYAKSHERLSYTHMEAATVRPTKATLPELRGLATPGPWIPAFEELVRVTDAEIPAADGILLIPGENPFFFTTGRAPQFPILLFDTTTDPYTPQETLEEARRHNIRWLILNRNTQLMGSPIHDLPLIVSTLQQDFRLERSLSEYDIYRRK